MSEANKNGYSSVSDLSEALGYKSAEKLYRLKRNPDSRPSFEILRDITNLFENVDLHYLITNEFDNRSVVNEPAQVYKMRTDRTIQDQDIPLYKLEASAGLVNLFQHQGDTKPIDYISIPNLPKCDGAISVTGDSMYPLLKSGDIIMYKEINNEISNIFFGEMYLISLDLDGEEYVSVKWVQKSDKGEDYVKLVSENQHHQPKDVPLKSVRAMALIKASIRINAMR